MTGPTKSKRSLGAAGASHRDKLFWDERAKEQEKQAAKILRLRALRLAKEAAEQEAVKARAAATPAPPVKKATSTRRRASGGRSTAPAAPDDTSGS